MNRVVVTGMGAITPVGNDVDTFWNSLKQGTVGIGPITSFDTADYKVKLAAEVKDFDPKQYMDPKAARRMERFSQLAVAASKQALEDAGIDMEKRIPTGWASASAPASAASRPLNGSIRSFWKKGRDGSIPFWCR